MFHCVFGPLCVPCVFQYSCTNYDDDDDDIIAMIAPDTPE